MGLEEGWQQVTLNQALARHCWHWLASLVYPLHSCLPSRGGGLEVGAVVALAVPLIREAPRPALEAAAGDALTLIERLGPTLVHKSLHGTPIASGCEEAAQAPGVKGLSPATQDSGFCQQS